MNIVSAALVFVFVAAWVVGVVAWFGALAEVFGVWKFWPRVYGRGYVVVEDSRILSREPGGVPETGRLETAHGVFDFPSENECLFRSKLSFGGLRLHTPFSLKGSITWVGEQATIRGRAPVGPAVFMVAWLVGWIAGSALAISAPEGPVAFGLLFLVMGVGVVAAMVGISIPIERDRLARLVEEFERRQEALGGRGDDA